MLLANAAGWVMASLIVRVLPTSTVAPAGGATKAMAAAGGDNESLPPQPATTPAKASAAAVARSLAACCGREFFVLMVLTFGVQRRPVNVGDLATQVLSRLMAFAAAPEVDSSTAGPFRPSNSRPLLWIAVSGLMTCVWLAYSLGSGTSASLGPIMTLFFQPAAVRFLTNGSEPQKIWITA